MDKILVIFGTRPEAIKMAPVIREFEKYRNQIRLLICVTAQHRQMLDQVLSLFNLKPDIDLNLMERNQVLASFSSNALLSLTRVLEETKPDLVLVQGDTTTAMVATLASFYLKIPVAHIEAGLRTYNNLNPFPEEANRRIISALASYHFAPTPSSQDVLSSEGIRKASIFLTGNTVIDALSQMLEKIRIENYVPAYFPIRSNSNNHRFILVTAHRRENFGTPLRRVCQSIKGIVEKNPEIQILYPVHLNPNVKETVYSLLSDHKRIHLISPLDYKDLCFFMDRSYLILTDSGGIQEEAPSLGKPVLVMRETTERLEAIEAGVARLVGTNPDTIIHAVQRLLDDKTEYRRMAMQSNPFGDGKASKRIVNILLGLPYEPFKVGAEAKDTGLNYVPYTNQYLL
ncbi:MAG: UDP-N-acetylglucosamine 2-epimerase (non-hydrolyzing) [Candidatus Helarchaeota archaeon]|nr:UDP-N-acetylglucosamine 2-epimerase (non-hydrolyzing) [Candidatus Helarchaeota archaeon]